MVSKVLALTCMAGLAGLAGMANARSLVSMRCCLHCCIEPATSGVAARLMPTLVHSNSPLISQIPVACAFRLTANLLTCILLAAQSQASCAYTPTDAPRQVLFPSDCEADSEYCTQAHDIAWPLGWTHVASLPHSCNQVWPKCTTPLVAPHPTSKPPAWCHCCSAGSGVYQTKMVHRLPPVQRRCT